MKTANVFLLFVMLLFSAPVFSEPGLEEIAEIRSALQDRRAKLGEMADRAKSRAANDSDQALAELRRISSELDVLDSKERKLRRLEELIGEGVGCVSGRCVNGTGKYVSKSGTSYEGRFANEKRDGYGTYQRSDGTFFAGEWKENRLEGECESGSPSAAKRPGTCSYSPQGNLEFSPKKTAAQSASPFELLGPSVSDDSRSKPEPPAPSEKKSPTSASDSPERIFLNALLLAAAIAFFATVGYQLHQRTEFFPRTWAMLVAAYPHVLKFIAAFVEAVVVAFVFILGLLIGIVVWIFRNFRSPELPPLEQNRGTFGIPPSQTTSDQRRRNSGLNPNHVTSRGVSASGDVPDSFH